MQPRFILARCYCEMGAFKNRITTISDKYTHYQFSLNSGAPFPNRSKKKSSEPLQKGLALKIF